MKRLLQKTLVTLTALTVMSACRSIALAQVPEQPGPEKVGEKRCGHCNRVVPSSAKAGDTCPFCGAQWVTEESKPANGGREKNFRSESVREHSAKSGGQKARTSPANADGDQFEMTATKYAIVIVGLAIGTLIVVLTIRFLIHNI
jgi:hypothetical protein